MCLSETLDAPVVFHKEEAAMMRGAVLADGAASTPSIQDLWMDSHSVLNDFPIPSTRKCHDDGSCGLQSAEKLFSIRVIHNCESVGRGTSRTICHNSRNSNRAQYNRDIGNYVLSSTPEISCLGDQMSYLTYSELDQILKDLCA